MNIEVGRAYIHVYRWTGTIMFDRKGYYEVVMASNNCWRYGLDAITCYLAVVDDFGNLHLVERLPQKY